MSYLDCRVVVMHSDCVFVPNGVELENALHVLSWCVRQSLSGLLPDNIVSRRFTLMRLLYRGFCSLSVTQEPVLVWL